MKILRCIFIFLLLILFNSFIILAQEITGDIVTGEAVTGEATQHEFDLGIYVSILIPPSLSISAPLNGTYLKTNNIPLIYSVSNYNSVWYNLDNGENKSTTAFFNTTQGPHTLFLYANNSQGTTSKNITFTVNPELFVIKYDKWNNSQNTSFPFNDSTYEELQNLGEVFFESTSNGKISFKEAIDLIQDSNPSDNFTNLNDNINISRNFVGLSSENLPNFNKSAGIYLYNLPFSNPRILKDGLLCPEEICTGIDYHSGTLYFDVEHFTTYSAEETPEEEEEDDGGGGGGGGATGDGNITRNATNKYVFSSKPSVISMDVEKGKSYLQQVILSNTGTTDLKINVLSSATISRFIEINERSFILKKGESRVYSFHVYSSANVKADLYVGKLIFSSDKTSVSVDMAINVQELPVLFDMKITSTREYVSPGRIASAEIKIMNIGDMESVDAVLEYGIMDFNNVIYVSKTENITIKKGIFSKRISLKLPESLEMGRYIIYSKATYEDKVAVSNDIFQIEQISLAIWITLLVLISLLIIFVLFAIVLIRKRMREKAMKNRLKK